MADGTKIEWADASCSPIRARNRETGRPGWYCSHASPGCDHCYSEALNRRLGTGIDYRAQDRDQVEIYLDEAILRQPLRWKRGRRIFWNSMSDTFGEFVPDEWIDRIFAVCALTPQHRHLILTKRAARMRDYLDAAMRIHAIGKQAGEECPLPIAFTEALSPRLLLENVWLGVSVEDQRRADERIPELLKTPAAVRWVSYEPALGPVSLRWLSINYREAQSRGETITQYDGLKRLDWVVVGGESGPGARPFDIGWARSIVRQCRAAGVACFVKQLGAYPYGMAGDTLPPALNRIKLRDRKGGNISEWPEDLRVREYPA
jgi:protein gp37